MTTRTHELPVYRRTRPQTPCTGDENFSKATAASAASLCDLLRSIKIFDAASSKKWLQIVCPAWCSSVLSLFSCEHHCLHRFSAVIWVFIIQYNCQFILKGQILYTTLKPSLTACFFEKKKYIKIWYDCSFFTKCRYALHVHCTILFAVSQLFFRNEDCVIEISVSFKLVPVKKNCYSNFFNIRFYWPIDV